MQLKGCDIQIFERCNLDLGPGGNLVLVRVQHSVNLVIVSMEARFFSGPSWQGNHK
jgi:hypothetical protein